MFINNWSFNFLKNRNTAYIIIIFIIALLMRIILVQTAFQGYTMSDGILYHNLAVNLTTGHGYTREISPPYNPYFFREPVYPLYIAMVYKIWDIFMGNINYLDPNSYDIKNHSEIKFLKFNQAILGALTIVIFYLVVNQYLRSYISFIISVIFALYIPLAVFSTQIMRETLQTFLVISMSFFLIKYFRTKKYRWLIIFSVFWALVNMTLQITIFLPVVLFVFLFFIQKRFVYSVRDIVVSFIIMCIVISPWLIRSYNFFPNWRIFKTLGVSLTYEQLEYVKMTRKLGIYKIISEDEVYRRLHEEWYDISEKEKFEKSFNGYYVSKTKAMSILINETFSVTKFFKNTLKSFRAFWIESLWVTSSGKKTRLHMRPHSIYKANKNYTLFVASMSGFIFGYISFLGFFLFFKKLYLLLPMFIYFFMAFPFISSAARRSLPVQAFIIMFSTLSIFFIILKIVYKWKTSEINDFLFKV